MRPGRTAARSPVTAPRRPSGPRSCWRGCGGTRSQPRRAEPPGELTYGEALTLLRFAALPAPAIWPQAAAVLEAAVQGDASALETIARGYASEEFHRGLEPGIAILCADSPARQDAHGLPLRPPPIRPRLRPAGPLAAARLPNSGAGCGVQPLLTQALVHVPSSEAADASGLLATTIQLSQVAGVAVFGGLSSAPAPRSRRQPRWYSASILNAALGSQAMSGYARPWRSSRTLTMP
jgi:hypothetical protein